MSNRLFRCMAVAALIAVSGCVVPQPETAAKPVRDFIDSGASEIVVSANPQASAAGLAILRAGGTAVDAAIAMQAVLGLVEPQGSGLLGGSVTLVWDPKTSEITTYDGMATAAAAATKAVTLGRNGNLLDPRELPFSPRAVGVPGVIPALYVAHRAQGKLSWEALFEPAIALAEPKTAQEIGEAVGLATQILIGEFAGCLVLTEPAQRDLCAEPVGDMSVDRLIGDVESAAPQAIEQGARGLP